MKACSCGIYARLYTLIHRSLRTRFRGFFRFMNGYDGTPHPSQFHHQNKASRTSLDGSGPPFSTSLSTGVERRAVIPIQSINLAEFGESSGSNKRTEGGANGGESLHFFALSRGQTE